jgi:hypothetical protein
VTHRYASDADSELWLIARAGGRTSEAVLVTESIPVVQREILAAPLKAPLGLPGRLGKHVRTATSDPRDFVERAMRAATARIRPLLRRR